MTMFYFAMQKQCVDCENCLYGLSICSMCIVTKSSASVEYGGIAMCKCCAPGLKLISVYSNWWSINFLHRLSDMFQYMKQYKVKL